MYASAEQGSRERVQVLADQLYRERYQYLLRIAQRNGAGDGDAGDAVNDAFAAFISKFDSDGEAPPLAWLTTTVKRAAWAAYRRQHLDRRVGQEAAPDSAGSGFSVADIPAETAGVEETIERAEYVLEARERLGALKPAERRALGLFAAGCSYAEISEMNQWTYTKTNRCINEGRAALRASAAGV